MSRETMSELADKDAWREWDRPTADEIRAQAAYAIDNPPPFASSVWAVRTALDELDSIRMGRTR